MNQSTDDPQKEKELNLEEREKLDKQNSRLMTDFKASKFEKESRKHWDLFYKRNETRFFKDRHWTTREFRELVDCDAEKTLTLLEVGCGVGNFVFPLLEDGLNLFAYVCDFSPRAVDFVKRHDLYDEEKIKAFQCDVVRDKLEDNVPPGSVDVVSMIFVLSAIKPTDFSQALANVYNALRPGGMIILRDYGLYDMAMIRFSPGSKISDSYYARQDGTTSYFFSKTEIGELMTSVGFEVEENDYVYRRTVNPKEGVDVERVFVQGKYRKPK